MLRTPAPFPQVGSYALIELEGRHHLARIQHRTHGGDVVISLPLLRDVASGNRTVALDELIDGTPLSDFEAGEADRLASALAEGSLKGARRKSAEEREDALRDRLVHAPILAEMMERLPDPMLRASKVAA